jgi:mRNA-degrading endonuclease RelE of RelBE toxin-antitoxin system
MSEGWAWRLVGKAKDDYRALDPPAQTRLADKLDEVVENPWREPSDWAESLTGGPYDRLRVGDWRCAVSFDHDEEMMTIHRIKQRRDAYKADD